VVSNRINDSHHSCSELNAIGEAVPLRVNAPVLAIPAYGYPWMVRINIVMHPAIVALTSSFSSPDQS
jgi:hypothetical protein